MEIDSARTSAAETALDTVLVCSPYRSTACWTVNLILWMLVTIGARFYTACKFGRLREGDCFNLVVLPVDKIGSVLVRCSMFALKWAVVWRYGIGIAMDWRVTVTGELKEEIGQ
jgi:hypothetical protein